jgi:multiple sugar transport system permease protein
VFAVPALVLLVLVSFYPLVVSVWMSLSDVNIGTINGQWDFVGLRNYFAVFESPVFLAVLAQTVAYVVLVVSVGLIGGLVVAVILKRGTRLAYAVGALMLFVWSLPPVVGGSLWKFSYSQDGPINGVFRLVGMEPVPWLVDGQFALFSVAMVNAWVAIPFTSAVLRAALLDIPPELLEASSIDGAGAWRQFRHVVLPLLVPTMSVLGVLMVLSAFRSFDYIYVMTAGGPGQATSTLPFLSYTQSFVIFRFDQGAAIAVIAIILVLPVVWFYLRLRRREVSQ